MRFELEHLESYDDRALLDEVRRVAALVGSPKLSIAQFSKHAKVHGSTLQKRFGGWRNTLRAAGLSDLVDTRNSRLTREQVLEALSSVANSLGRPSVTLQAFTAHTGITGGPVRKLFGSWSSALAALGMNQSPLGMRYSDEECFENMLSVWTHYGRPPQHDEMNAPPSAVGSKAYVRRWGTWRKALSAFVTRANATESADSAAQPEAELREVVPARTPALNQGPRDIPLALRYYVLRRDSFRCVTCGRSPAVSPGVVLHIDHIVAWIHGGRTFADNLRTLCQSCNLGKGSAPA